MSHKPDELDEVDVAQAFDVPKRGAGHEGRPGVRVPMSWCFLCEMTHPEGVCPLSPEERERAVKRRLMKQR